jgi:hypothetical protein
VFISSTQKNKTGAVISYDQKELSASLADF